MDNTTDLEVLQEKYRVYLSAEMRLSENTVSTYSQMLHQYAEFVKAGGVRFFAAPQPGELQTYLESVRNRRWQHRPVKPRTLALHVDVLRPFYRWLALCGHTSQLAIRPVLDLQKPKLDEPLQPALSHEQMQELLDAPHSGRNRLLHKACVEVLYSSACRVSELTGMRLSDLDIVAGNIRCRVKGGSDRVLYLGRYATAALLLYITDERPQHWGRYPNCPWLFISPRKTADGRMTRSGVYEIVRRRAQKVGITFRVTPHTLRRSAALHLLLGGSSLRAVMQYLGHTSPGTTQQYLRLDPSEIRKAHDDFHPHGRRGRPPLKARASPRSSNSLQWPERLIKDAEDKIDSVRKQQTDSTSVL